MANEKPYNGGKRRLVAVTLGIVLVPFLGGVDFLTGQDFSFSIFYLVPVFLITWHAGRGAGAAASIACGLAWLAADLAGDQDYSSPVYPYWNMVVRFGFFIIITLILSRLKNALASEKKLARQDALTGLANRRYFLRQVDTEMYRASRYGRPLSTVYIDLDNFKTVNDSLGHAAGDALLRKVAGTIRDNVRQTDIAGRFGGDEFILLLPETGPVAARTAAEKLRRGLLAVMEGNGWTVTFSIGVATFIRPPSTVDEMVQKADDIMYAVKRNGKNGISARVFGV